MIWFSQRHCTIGLCKTGEFKYRWGLFWGLGKIFRLGSQKDVLCAARRCLNSRINGLSGLVSPADDKAPKIRSYTLWKPVSKHCVLWFCRLWSSSFFFRCKTLSQNEYYLITFGNWRFSLQFLRLLAFLLIWNFSNLIFSTCPPCQLVL